VNVNVDVDVVVHVLVAGAEPGKTTRLLGIEIGYNTLTVRFTVCSRGQTPADFTR